MPKSASPSSVGVRSIARRLAAEAGRPFGADETITPSALASLAFELAYAGQSVEFAVEEDAIIVDEQTTARAAGLAAALERCAEELANLEQSPSLKALVGAVAELQSLEQARDVASALKGARRELAGGLASAASEFRLAKAHLEEASLQLRRALSARSWSPLPKVQIVRGAFYPNLAKDLHAAGFDIPKIGNLIDGRLTGKARRASQNRIRKARTAKGDTATAILDLGAREKPAYCDSVISELKSKGLEVSRVGP